VFKTHVGVLGIVAGFFYSVHQVCTILNLIHSHMIQGVAQDDDKVGLVIAHFVCSWIEKQISELRLCALRHCQANLASSGGEEVVVMQLLGKVRFWISQMVCQPISLLKA